MARPSTGTTDHQSTMKLQPAVKKETGYVAAGTAGGTLVMFVLFFVLHRIFPENVPFGWRVILAGIIGCIVAVLNFLLMGITVQKVTSIEDEDRAKRTMTVSLRYRTIMQLVWVVLSIVLPVFNLAAGIIPLFIPSLVIKARGAKAGLTKKHKASADGSAKEK